MTLRNLSVALVLPLLSTAALALTVGDKAPTLKLDGDAGGLVSGGAWSSDTIKDKVWVVLYVDPDEKDANPDLEKALDAQKFPSDVYGSIAVINMDATWLPNAAIASSLESKQKDHPDTVYVKDMKKRLVKDWSLKDDAYVVTVFDKAGKLLFLRHGTLSKADIDACIDTIKKAL